MVGSGDGVVRVYYDPDRSVNGARLCAVRTRAKVKQTDYVSNLAIIAPYSLPMFREVKIFTPSNYLNDWLIKKHFAILILLLSIFLHF